MDAHRLLAAIAVLTIGIAITVTAGQYAPNALADGFGWGSPTVGGPTAQIMADGFGWGAPASTAGRS